MKPNLIDMMTFQAVVEARSFTAAAERLGRTKSAVSQSVSRLEADLDCRLLQRSTRALSMTEAGARFLSHCQELKQTYDAAVADLSAEQGDPAGLLSLTAPHALCGPLVVPAIERFLTVQGKVRVRLVAEDAPVDLIETGIDLAIRVGRPKEQAARIARLGVLRESLYASPACVARFGGVPEKLSELADWDHIANSWQGNPVTYTRGGGRLRVSPRIRCNTLPEILQLVERGLGVALLPDLAVAGQMAEARLTRLFTIAETPLHTMHNFAARPPRKVVDFVKLLRAELRHGAMLDPASA